MGFLPIVLSVVSVMTSSVEMLQVLSMPYVFVSSFSFVIWLYCQFFGNRWLGNVRPGCLTSRPFCILSGLRVIHIGFNVSKSRMSYKEMGSMDNFLSFFSAALGSVYLVMKKKQDGSLFCRPCVGFVIRWCKVFRMRYRSGIFLTVNLPGRSHASFCGSGRLKRNSILTCLLLSYPSFSSVGFISKLFKMMFFSARCLNRNFINS